MKNDILEYDIIIVGGGIVGLTLALALAQKTSLSIAVLEANKTSPLWDDKNYHHRVSAITLASQRIFEEIGVWKNIAAKRVSPFKRIEVWDTQGGEIHFDSKEIAESILGYIIENNLMLMSLREKILQYPTIEFIAPVELIALEENGSNVTLLANDHSVMLAPAKSMPGLTATGIQKKFITKLLIAADGANSWVRTQANIAVKRKEYDQQAIVATIETTQPHQHIARQIFLESGPLAFLPLAEKNLCSIVWTLPIDEATRIKNLSAEDFRHALANAFSKPTVISANNVISAEAGISSIQEDSRLRGNDTRFSFPLYKQEAKQYVKKNIALVGEAAHTVHPLAGQGLNIGLSDAVSLAQIISAAVSAHRDYASYATLRKYERTCRANNLPLIAGIDIIKKIFASKNKSLQFLRANGLKLTNQTTWLKNLFTKHAAG